MKTQHVFGASAATVLAVTMAAFAQAPQSSQPATPAGQSPGQAQAASQDRAGRQAETPVTLVGCVMREADYRKSADAGKGGPVGTGLGRGDEFVLVNAKKTTAGTASTANVDCSAATPSGEAFELSGTGEKNAAKYLGSAVEISGTLKPAKTEAAGPAGEAKPTGGFDPLKQDLKLFEVDVVSVRPIAPQGAAAAPPAAAAPAAAPEPAAQAAQPPAPAAPSPAPAPPAQQSASAAPRSDLPRTASPVPLIGLLGLLALASGLALRRLT